MSMQSCTIMARETLCKEQAPSRSTICSLVGKLCSLLKVCVCEMSSRCALLSHSLPLIPSNRKEKLNSSFASCPLGILPQGSVFPLNDIKCRADAFGECAGASSYLRLQSGCVCQRRLMPGEILAFPVCIPQWRESTNVGALSMAWHGTGKSLLVGIKSKENSLFFAGNALGIN